MEIFLISNNLYENNLSYVSRHELELKKMTRPLSIEGEEAAKNLSLSDSFLDINAIYSSIFASSIASAKYLSSRLNKLITINEDLNDCKIGELGNRSIKMVRFMQNHDFNIKLNNGESLDEVGCRIEKVINDIAYTNHFKVAVFTHRRSILGYLIKHCKAGYNLDDNLIIEYNDKTIFTEEEKDIDIIKLTFENRKLVDVSVLDL